MIHIHCQEVVQQGTKMVQRVLVWDWKTGGLVRLLLFEWSCPAHFTQVLDLPSTDECTLVGEDTTTIAFLDEFRMVVLTPDNTMIPRFTLFDTLVSGNHSVGSWRFRVPPRYQDWFPTMYVDGDRYLGALDQDTPLATDPAQAIFVVKLVSPNGPQVVLVVRIQILIEHVCSMSPDIYVPWDEWGRGAVVMEIPQRAGAYDGSYPLVHGVHMTWVTMAATPGVDGCLSHPHLCAFDLSWRGLSILPLWDEGGGTERRVSLEDGWHFLLQGSQGMNDWGFYSLADGRFMYLVSRSHFWKSGGMLTPG